MLNTLAYMRKLVRSAGGAVDAATPPRNCTPLPCARCRRTGAIGGQADMALERSNRHSTHKDIRCRYLITASRTKNAGRHSEAEGVGGLAVHDELELGRLHGRVGRLSAGVEVRWLCLVDLCCAC